MDPTELAADTLAMIEDHITTYLMRNIIRNKGNLTIPKRFR